MKTILIVGTLIADIITDKINQIPEYMFSQSCYVAKHHRYKYACCKDAINGVETCINVQLKSKKDKCH